MALSAELLKKFKSDEAPLSNKLLAAKTLFLRSQFCFISKKEELVLEWLLDLAYQEYRIEIWQTIRDCLDSPNMQNLKLVDIRPSINKSFVELLLRTLESRLNGKASEKTRSVLRNLVVDHENGSSIVRECAILFIETNVCSFYLQQNVDKYVKLSNFILKSAAENNDIEIFFKFIKSVGIFCDQSLKKEDASKIFMDKLFVPIFEAYCVLKSVSNISQDGDFHLTSRTSLNNVDTFVTHEQEVKCELLCLIEQMIFPNSMHKRFKEGLLNLFENHIFSYSTLRPLCQFLAKNAKSCDTNVLLHVYKFIFQSFVHHYKNDFNTIYRLFVVFCCLLGFEPSVEKSDDSSKSLLTEANISHALRWKINFPVKKCSTLVLKELVLSLKETSVILDETVNEISFKQWMQALVIQVVYSSNADYLAYVIIDTVIELNPLIVEPIINKVLQHILIQPKVTKEEKEAYRAFFHSLLNMFIKLNRVQNFINSNLFPTLKQIIQQWRLSSKGKLKVEIVDVIPRGIDLTFDNFVATLRGQMCISLLHTFTTFLVRDVVKPMEMDNFDEGHGLFFAVLEHLLVSYLKGVRMAEQAVLQNVCTAFMTRMKELRACLGRLGSAFLRHNQHSSTLEGFLRLCWAAGEVQILILLYSPWSRLERDLQLVECMESDSVTNLHCYLSFLKPQQWDMIAQQAHEHGEVCQEALKLLLIQKLRVLVLFGNSIESCMEMQATLCDYLMESLSGSQFLQKNQDVAILVPLLPQEKLLSLAESLSKLFTVEQSSEEMFELLRSPVHQENKNLLVALAWTSVHKIGSILAKQKRTFGSEKTILNHRCLVKDVMSSLDFSIVITQQKRKAAALESFTRAAQKLNEACLDVLKTDRSKADSIPVNVTALSKHLMLLRSLPLPFLPQRCQTVLAMGVLAVMVVLSEQPEKSLETTCCGKAENGSDAQTNLMSLKNLCREILQGLLEGPTSASLSDVMNGGLIVRLLHEDGQCPKTLLLLLFEEWLGKPDHLQDLAEAVCIADEHVKENIDPSISPISTFLLNILTKKNMSNAPDEVRSIYKKITRLLVGDISKRIESQMKKEGAMEADALPLLEAFCSVMPYKGTANVASFAETFISCAFSVLENQSSSEDRIHTAESVMEAVMRNSMRVGKEVCEKLMWKVYKSIDRPQLVAKLLKSTDLADFNRVLKDLCGLQMLGNEASKLFPDLRLPQSIVSMALFVPKVTVVQNMVVEVSTVAYKRILEGSSQENLLEFLKFLQVVVLQTKVSLASCMADIILTTLALALEVPSMSMEHLLSVGPIVAQILLMMVLHQFALLVDRIPAFLQVYHLLLRAVIVNSSADAHLEGQSITELSKCALLIERLSNAMTRNFMDFKIVSQYMVADLLQEFEQISIHPCVKVHIMNSLYTFLSICDKYATVHLSYALPPASLELFKSTMSSYKKFHHYTGKV